MIQNPALTADLRILGTPYVLVNRELRNDEHTVIVDYQAGTSQAVKALAALGHRVIAYISGPLEHYTGRKRLAGIVDGHSASGLAFDISRVAQCDYSRAAAEDAMLAQFEHPAGRPTAVCAANVVIASGILAAAARRGLDVPDDLSVIALSDSPAAQMLTPAISAVEYPFFELGHAAADHLMDCVEGGKLQTANKILAPTGVLARQSMAPNRK